MLAIDGGSPVRDKMLKYSGQVIDEADIAAVAAVMRGDYLTTGPMVGEFECAMAGATQSRYAVAVSNGTAALHSALYALGIHEGDEVIVPVMTFAASANAARYLGATVVFSDVEPDTLQIGVRHIERLLTPRTRAVVVVDYAGLPADMPAIMALLHKSGVGVVEDAAHSLGGSCAGRPVGSMATLTTFSFHPVKTITTGEGGAVTTETNGYALRMRAFRNHGISTVPSERKGWEYNQLDLGYNYRLTDIQAALGLSQLSRVGEFLERRRRIAGMYREAFADLPEIECPVEPDGRVSAWHLFVVRFNLEMLRVNRSELYHALRAEGIGVNVHYAPVPWHPYYRKLGYAVGGWPVAESAYKRMLSLPIWPGMTDLDTQNVIEAVVKVVGEYRS